MKNDRQRKVQKYFDWEFRKHPSFLLYDTNPANFFIPSEKYARELLGNYDTGLKILEIGSGDCIDSITVAGSKNKVWAVEISQRRLNQAYRNVRSADKSERISPIFMDAHKLGFKDNSFDLILGNSVLLFLERKQFISECYRVLKPNCRVLFSHESMAKHPMLVIWRNIPKMHQREVITRRITIDDILEMREQFEYINHRQFYFLSVFFAPLISLSGDLKIVAVLTDIVYKIDKLLLRLMPILKEYCWVSVIELRK